MAYLLLGNFGKILHFFLPWKYICQIYE